MGTVLALAMIPVAVLLAGSLRTNQGRTVLPTCMDGYSARLVALFIGGWELAAHGLPREEPAPMQFELENLTWMETSRRR